MRVLMLSWEFPPVLVGGLGRHVHALSAALVRAGHEVTVVTRHQAGVPYTERVDGVDVVRVPEDPLLLSLSNDTLLPWAMGFNHALTRAALRVARAGRFDVVHAHDWLVAHAAVTVKEQLDLPLVVTVHATEAGRHQGWLPGETNRTIHSVEHWLVQQASRLLVCSQYMRWEIGRLLDARADRVDVVPNGVHWQAWQPTPPSVLRVRRRFAGAGPLLGFAGRLVYEKGVQNILEAMPELRCRYPGLRLVVAGDGPYRATLEELARQYGVSRAVSFTGFLGGGLPGAMAAFDVMIVPSLYEPFGMVAIEGAATGAPLVVADTGGLREFVDDHRTGVMFAPGDAAALTAAIRCSVDDRPAARGMARQARTLVYERYGWSGIATGTVAAYRRARRATAGFSSAGAAVVATPVRLREISGRNLLTGV